MPNQDHDDIPRRRGRPTGKNRVPLSAEERRARNAQYERERRNEYAEAMLDLAVAATGSGCESGISNPELLATVINRIQRAAQRSPSKDIEELRRINDNLELQIASLTERLENESETCDMPAAKKIKLSETSELRTDAKAQTSNCLHNPDDRAAPKTNKRKNKLRIDKGRKIPRLSTTPRYNQPHSSMETTLPVSWSEVESSQSSHERSESETPTPQSYHTETCSEDSSYSAQQQYSPQKLNGKGTLPSLIEVKIECDSSDSHSQSSFHTQTELHEGFARDQMNQLEPQAMQMTQYSPPPDLVTEVKTFASQSDIHFQYDQLNIPGIQHTPDLESITDIFSDTDKSLLTEWINCNSDLFRTESYECSVQSRQWSNDDFLTL